MKQLVLPICFLVLGCTTVSQESSRRQPSEVTQNEQRDSVPSVDGPAVLTFSSRYELPRGSQMRSADVKRVGNICEVNFVRYTEAAAVGINLNAEIFFRGNRLAGTRNFEILTTQIPLAPPDYLNGKYTSMMNDPNGVEQRYIVTTDPTFDAVTKIVYEVYFQGKLQLSYFCEPEFIGT